jgi:transcriptional regulator with XRE-family HTH domain
MGSNLIRDIVKEAGRKQGISLSKLAIILGVNHVYLFGVLGGRKISRPLIRRISQVLHIPDLPEKYERFLSQRRVENKGKKTTATQKSRKNPKNPIKEVKP